MENKILIVSNTHANEKAACVLAGKVYDRLHSDGYNVDILSRPEEESHKAMILAAQKAGTLDNVGDKLDDLNEEYAHTLRKKAQEVRVFDFHNYPTNRKEFKYKMCEEDHIFDEDSWKKIVHARCSYKFGVILFSHDSNGIVTVETPAHYSPTLDVELEEAAQRLKASMRDPKYLEYLYDVDVSRTIEKGLLGDDVVDLVTEGIKDSLEFSVNDLVTKGTNN